MRRLVSGLSVSARFSTREILDLAASGSPDAEEHLKTIFAWYHDRAASTVRGLVRTAGAIVVAFLAAALADKADIEPWHVGAGTALASFLLILAAWTNWHLGHIQREFVVALRMLNQLEDHHEQLAEHVAATGGGR